MSKRSGISFGGMSVGMLFAVVAARALLMEAQSDTFWALRAGQDIWATGRVPRLDTYSYTAAGLPWPDHEWLWQAIVYGVHRLGGMPLLALGVGLLVIGAVAIVYRLMVGASGARFVLMLPAVSLASFVWVLRPQVASLFFLALLVRMLAHERFVLLPVLFLVWANAHGGVVLGGLLSSVALVTALTRACLFRDDPAEARRARWLAVIVALCALATAATPMGFGILRFAIESEGRLRSAQITEWMPTRPDLSIGGAFWVYALLYVGLLVRRWRTLRAAPWADWVIVACTTALLPLAFRSQRHIGPFLLLAPAAASRLLGADFGWRRAVPATPDHPRLNAALLGILAAGAGVAVAISWSLPARILGWRPLPQGVLEAVRACPGRLYNHYNQGGYLIWLVPETKVFIDNRQDPYPLPFLLDHVRVETGRSPWVPTFERWNIRCSFLSVESPTVAALAKAGWRDAYRDPRWAVQVAP